MKRFAIFFLTLFTLHYSLSTNLPADTITLNDGKELKGIVVEDYKDRLTFSTPDGEKSIMKTYIKELSIDDEEENLLKLAQQAQDRGDFITAYAFYDKAVKLNPASKRAKDGVVFVQGYLFRKEQDRKVDSVMRQQEVEQKGGYVRQEEDEEAELKNSVDILRASAGMTFGVKDGMVEIVDVKRASPAYDAGVRRGDLLISVWGRLTGYMSLKESIYAIIKKSSMEVRCVVEKLFDVAVNTGDINFTMEFDGLTVSSVKEGSSAELAGIMKDDLVVSIDGKSTRYMPLSVSVNTIKNAKDGHARLVIHREIVFWRT